MAAGNNLSVVQRNESEIMASTLPITMNTLMARNKRLQDKDEMVNEIYLRINVQEKWEEFLTPAPLAISVMGSLMLLTADEDVSLADQKPKNGSFIKIRHPESFRSCLVQVSNDSFQSFLTAHDSMMRITDIVQEVPSRLKTIILLLKQPNNETVSLHLPSHLDNFRADTDKCVVLAEAVEKKFAETIALIDEIVEAAVGTKGKIEEKEKEEERSLKRLKAQKEAQEASIKELEVMKKRAEAETEEALAKYRSAMDSMPGMGTMLGGMAAEAAKNCLQTGVATISTTFMSKNFAGAVAGGALGMVVGGGDLLSGIAGAGAGVSLASAIAGPDRQCGNKYAEIQHQQHQMKDAEGLALYQMANEAWQILQEVTRSMTASEYVCEQKTPDQRRDRLNDAKMKFERMQKKSSSAKIEEICSKGLKLSNKLSDKASEMNLGSGTKEKLNKKLKKLRTSIIEKETKFRSKMGLAGGLSESPFSMNAVSKNGGNVPLSTSIVETWRIRVEGEREDWKQLREQRNKVLEKHLEENKEMAKLVGQIMSIDLSKVDMDSKIKYLKTGIIFLSEIKEHWTRLVLFFKKISVIISGPLKRAADQFSSTARIEYDRQKSIAGYTMDGFVRDLVYQQALKAAGYSIAVNQFTSSYVAISNEHIMPKLSRLNKIMALSTKEEQIAEQERLKADCDEATLGIKNYLLKEKDSFGARIKGRLDKMAQEYDTILPPLDEEIRSAIEAGTKNNALEYKEPPSLMERVGEQCDNNDIDMDAFGF